MILVELRLNTSILKKEQRHGVNMHLRAGRSPSLCCDQCHKPCWVLARTQRVEIKPSRPTMYLPNLN